MECKYCHTTNVEDAAFCKSCGARIDGKITCPKCKKSVVDDATYCNYCGTRLVNKTVIDETGEVVVKPHSDKWKKVLNYVGTSFALFGVVVALLFVYLIGFSANTDDFAINSSSAGNLHLEGVNIYYFLGKNFQDVQNTIDQQVGTIYDFDKYEFISPSLYIPAVLCAVIAGATIIAVVTLSIMAIIKLIRKLIGKETKHAEGYAVAAFLSYALGAALLHVFNNVTSNVIYRTSSGALDTNASVHAQMTYSPATVAGLTLGAIAIFVCIGCRVACLGAELKNKPTLLNVILGGAAALFVMLAANYASAALYCQLLSANSYTVSIALPVNAWLAVWARNLGVVDNGWDGEFFMLTMTMILQVAFVVVAITAILLQCNALLKNKKYAGAGISITLAAVAVVYTTFTAIAHVKLAAMVSASDNLTLTYIPCIVASTFALLALGTSVARTIINKKAAKRENAEQQSVEEQPVVEEASTEQAPAAE